MTISPVLSNRSAVIAESITFLGLELTQLSEFYKISVSDGRQTVSRIIVIPTDNMPEGRERAVVSGVVNDKSCFYRYIAFLLGDSHVLSAMEAAESGEGVGAVSKGRKSAELPAIYEKMLYIAATDPDRFREIEYLISSISDDGVIPEGFAELYNTFKRAVRL